MYIMPTLLVDIFVARSSHHMNFWVSIPQNYIINAIRVATHPSLKQIPDIPWPLPEIPWPKFCKNSTNMQSIFWHWGCTSLSMNIFSMGSSGRLYDGLFPKSNIEPLTCCNIRQHTDCWESGCSSEYGTWPQWPGCSVWTLGTLVNIQSSAIKTQSKVTWHFTHYTQHCIDRSRI